MPRARGAGYAAVDRRRGSGLHNSRLHVQSEAAVGSVVGIPWSAVVLVDFLTEKEITCPICMDEPMFPRITQCGHVYCLPCLIRFRQALGSSCAICSEFILAKEVRPCRVQLTPSTSVGSLIKFALVAVDLRGVALPAATYVGASLPTQSTAGWWLSAAVRTSAAELARHLTRESHELERRLAAELYLDDAEASGLIVAHEEVLEQLGHLPKASVSTTLRYSPYLEVSEAMMAETAMTESAGRGFTADANKTYLYQCAAGSAVFLDPLWSRAVLTEFAEQDWTKAHLLPRSLDLLVTKADSITVDEATKRRYRCVSHLGEGDSAVICDADLDGVLTSGTRSLLAKALERREREKAERQLQDARDEERRRQYEAKAAKDAMKLFNVHRLEPQVLPKPEDFLPLPRSSTSSTQPHSVQPAAVSSSSASAESPQLTFAQIAQRARPVSDLSVSPETARLMDSFILTEAATATDSDARASKKTKKKKSVFRLAG